jgi:hypothetical protein
MRKKAREIALYLCAALCPLAIPARALTIVNTTSGISISVVRDGTYRIDTAAPAWTFSGAVMPGVSDIRVNSGTDSVGEFQEIAFEEKGKGGRHFAIRTWPGRPGVLFTQTLSTTSVNPPPFPRFTVFPTLPYNVSFGGCWFGVHFDLTGREGPWVMFDGTAQTAVLSPAANFMVAKLRLGTTGELESDIDPAIATLPEGFSHSTLLVVDRGINRAFDSWGHLLTDIQGKVRPSNDADASLKYLGYWTDNGAAYYYNYDPSKGYEGTLLAIRDEFVRNGLPIGYVQLDSWWYRKGATGDWNPKPDQWNFGIHTYVAHPDLFPDGLAGFQQRLALPLVTHARWIDDLSPYRSQYKISNNVAIDPQYWKDIADYLKQSGVTTYEQDWLNSRAQANFNLADQEAFMDNMAGALAAAGITMQYCMPTPRHVLQGSKYSNLTSIRMSDDHFERSYWPQVIYASRLANSIGIWPWVDVFSSDDVPNLMIATLTGGIVGASDAIGQANIRNLQRVARADGVIVKPDAPLVPTDSTFVAEAQNGPGPMVAYTYTDNGGNRAVYVVAFRRGEATSVALTPTETGLTGNVFVYDMRHRTGVIASATVPMQLDLTNDWMHVVLVQAGRSGIAVVGDASKFVPRGRARIASLIDHDDSVDVEVAFAAGEKSVTLVGYSPTTPVVSGGALSWNAATGVFELVVTPASARVRITAAPPRRRPL